MSASTERKNRLAAREAGTDKKTLAAQEAAKKARKSKIRWTLGTIGVLVLIAAILFFNSGLFYRTVPAVQVDGKNYSTATVNYYYGTDYINLVNQYGSYASMFGLDTSTGLAGLASSDCPMLEDGTWRDYFLQQAGQDLVQIKSLKDYAAANGITLDADEQAEIQENLASVADAAKEYGFPSANRYLSALYGKGVNQSVLRQALTDRTLAGKAYDSVSDAQTYTPEELEAEYESYEGSRDLFHYATYFVSTGLDADAEHEQVHQAMTEARATAEAILTGFKERESDDYITELNAAVDHEVPGAQATERSNVSGGSLEESYKSWMLDASRKAGDNLVVESEAEDGVTLVIFLDRNDNHYNTVNVRHILVQFAADADGNVSDEQKELAKTKAENILSQWQEGEATEDSFAALARELSEDEGSKAEGGLYENVYRGQMVGPFEDFCYADHQPGDTGIVETSYGYHVMYYVGQGEQYSNVLARNSLLSAYMDEWLESLIGDKTAEPRFGYKLVG